MLFKRVCSFSAASFFPSQLSSGLSRLLAKYPGIGDYKLWLSKVVSLKNISSAEWHLPRIETSALCPVSNHPGFSHMSLKS